MNDKICSLVFIFTIPRSLSTIFSRIVMEYPNTHIMVDRFVQVVLEEKEYQKSDKSYAELARKIEDEIDNELKKGKNVVLKDMAMYLNDYFQDSINILIKKYNPKILFLVRHPTPCHVSTQKMIVKERKIGKYSEELLMKMEREEKFEKLWLLYERFKGYVLIAEELQRNPSPTLKSAYDYLGWIWDDKYLKFDSLEEKGVPDHFNVYRHYYEDCINSTEFRQMEPILTTEFKEEWEKQNIEKSLKFYDLFINECAYLNK